MSDAAPLALTKDVRNALIFDLLSVGPKRAAARFGVSQDMVKQFISEHRADVEQAQNELYLSGKAIDLLVDRRAAAANMLADAIMEEDEATEKKCVKVLEMLNRLVPVDLLNEMKGVLGIEQLEAVPVLPAPRKGISDKMKAATLALEDINKKADAPK